MSLRDWLESLPISNISRISISSSENLKISLSTNAPVLLSSNDSLNELLTHDVNLAPYPQKINILSRYTAFITCQQCEHLSVMGECTKLSNRVMVAAMRECGSFEPIVSERPDINDAGFTKAENEDFLMGLEKSFFSHLVECSDCYVQQARYCTHAKETGIIYDGMLLLVGGHGQARREDYQLRIDKACIGGHNVLEVDTPPPS